MTSNQFQIQKEIQAKKVNEILQSVKLNSFPKEAKRQVIALCESAMETLDKLRVEVYKKTENFDYAPEKYDHTEERLQKYVEIIGKGKSIGKLQNSLLNSLSELIDQVERVKIDRITGENFSNLEKSPEYKDNEKLLLENLEELRAAILIEGELEEEMPATTEEGGAPGAETKTEEQLFEEQLAAEKAAQGNTEAGNTAAGSETKPEDTKKNWLGFGK